MKISMRTRATTCMLATAIVMGCAGRAANPVMTSQYGDQGKSCEALDSELAFIQGEIQRLVPQTEKTAKNVVLGVTGWFLLVPWFFMDFSQAEQVEVDALRQRYNRLVLIAADKHCGFPNQEIPPFVPPK